MRPVLVVDGNDFERDLFSCCLKAAVSKCLDFNDAAHSKAKTSNEGHLFVSGMRGICEDLIVLRFLAQVGVQDREEYLNALIRKNWWNGIAAQTRFFKANNSLQPVVGQGISDEEISASEDVAFKQVLVTSKQMGFRRLPTVSAMAKSVGLLATYEFIYFLTSNFVHFNPQALMRMGWGRFDDRQGKKQLTGVVFSTSYMDGYYRNLGKFYGTVLLIGFAHLLKGIQEFAAISLEKELAQIEGAIASLDRWPEVITFEEMNVRPPLFFILRAMRDVMKSEGQPVGYGQILEELKLGSEVHR